MGPFKRYLHICIMAFFISFPCVTLCQFYSVTSPVLFTKNNKLSNERKDNFLYIWLLQRITLYQRRQKIIESRDKIAFLDTHVRINHPYWQSSGILTSLCKYNIVRYTDRLLDKLFQLLAVIFLKLHEKLRRKD